MPFFFFPVACHAENDPLQPAITVINFIRGNGLGHESDDLLESLKAQWQVTKETGINATWLFQYGALENSGMTEFAKGEMGSQEFGLMFEIDKNYAQKSGVQFRGAGAWYRSDGLLLNSYDRSERRKLIDSAFALFKQKFGYYPKTVGAWWIGGDSLSYMQKKYGITAALRAADQFNLDFYSIWGTPWNIPYLPAKLNEGMPAASFETSTNVVILQWAIRDPLEGYTDPLYSLQDYQMKEGYTPLYVDYLASIFLQKPMGNFVIGLENGGTLETFGRSYKTMLTKTKEIETSGKADVLFARDYAQKFLAQKKVFATKNYILSTDYDSSDQSFWYISQQYRAAIQKRNNTVWLVDLRNYREKIAEDFTILPNSQSHLRINEPSIIDSMRFPQERIEIKKTSEPLSIQEHDTEVVLYAGNERIASFTPTGCTLSLESGTEKVFSFEKGNQTIYPSQIIVLLYIIYFSIIYLYRENIHNSLKECLILLIPFCFASQFLMDIPTVLFDKKETVLFFLFSLFHFLPVGQALLFIKILPFIILFLLHFLWIIRSSGTVKKMMFWGYVVFLACVYCHLPYFPLDKTTYVFVLIPFITVVVLLFIAGFILWRKEKSKCIRILCVLIPLIMLLIIGTSVVFSRSRLALTPYEMDALEVIKQQKKSVVWVEEVDYGIVPIYKAVKPLLYANYWIGAWITGKPWDIITRPENNILNISGYDDRLIVIPRYVGTDISDYEITLLNLTKIFDNAQIAIFEKK